MIIVKGGVNWVDILKPSAEDVDFLQKRHKFHSIILDEILHSSIRPRVENYGSYLFFTMYVPIFDIETQTSKKEEIDFLITSQDIITVHYDKIEPLESFYRKILNDLNYKKEVLGSDTSRLLYYIIEHLIRFARRNIHHLNQEVNYISDEIFSGREEELLRKISFIKRNILDHQIIIQPQENIINSLLEESGKFWKNANIIYLTDLVGDYFKISQELNHYKKIVESLEDTNSQLLNAKVNRTMQRFTVLAILSYPLIFMTSILSVRPVIDFIGGDRNTWIVLGVSVIITITLLIIFRKKKWI